MLLRRLLSRAALPLARPPRAPRGLSSLSFEAAQARARAIDATDAQKLQLYALYKQATVGANATPKPGVFDFVGAAKWVAWSRLGAMPAAEAQAGYISLAQALGGGSAPQSPPPAAAPPAAVPPAAAPPAVPTPSGAGRAIVFREPLDAARGVVGVFLNAPPVNAMSGELMRALAAELRAAAADAGARAVVLGSAAPGVFSAGLDIREMAAADEAAFARFWGAVQELFLALYALPLPCAAAVDGASPAGGCFLALLSDHRALLDDPRAVIGLNEVALGIVAPPWFAAPLERAVGPREAERMLQLASLLPPARALALGLVDELAPRGAVLAAAVEAAARLGAQPAAARHLTKLMLRRPVLELLATPALRAEDLARTWAFFRSKDVQAGLNAYLARLAQRKK